MFGWDFASSLILAGFACDHFTLRINNLAHKLIFWQKVQAFWCEKI